MEFSMRLERVDYSGSTSMQPGFILNGSLQFDISGFRGPEVGTYAKH